MLAQERVIISHCCVYSLFRSYFCCHCSCHVVRKSANSDFKMTLNMDMAHLS